ncbi:MAG: hypothetical protein AABX66_03875 [Nanoarchaeota archaeon]
MDYFSPRQDIAFAGFNVGMNGGHYNLNPHNPAGSESEKHLYNEWLMGWGQGRVCLEWDNPAGVNVREVPKPGFVSRLIPVWEERPITLGFKDRLPEVYIPFG